MDIKLVTKANKVTMVPTLLGMVRELQTEKIHKTKKHIIKTRKT